MCSWRQHSWRQLRYHQCYQIHISALSEINKLRFKSIVIFAFINLNLVFTPCQSLLSIEILSCFWDETMRPSVNKCEEAIYQTLFKIWKFCRYNLICFRIYSRFQYFWIFTLFLLPGSSSIKAWKYLICIMPITNMSNFSLHHIWNSAKTFQLTFGLLLFNRTFYSIIPPCYLE